LSCATFRDKLIIEQEIRLAMPNNAAIEHFVAGCRAAHARGTQRVLEFIERAVRDASGLLAPLELTDLPGMRTMYRADDLTILHVVWAPKMDVPAHDHRMWAVIGVYRGCEINRYWCRRPLAAQGLQSTGTATLHAGEAVMLEADVIHSVTNPLDRATVAIHVYGGDFFAAERSEWASDNATEGRFDPQLAVQRFSAAGRADGN
jgi:hypothetical protein